MVTKLRKVCAFLIVATGCEGLASVPEAQASAPDPSVQAQPKAAESSTSDVDRFVGQYAVVGAARAENAVEQAIDSVVSQMNVLVREIARRRLQESNKVPQGLKVRREGKALVIGFDGREYKAVPGGPATQVVGVNGNELAYTVSLQGGRIRQRFQGEDGGRINGLSRAEDGTVTVHVEVHSEKLPAPVKYALHFRAKN